MKAHFLKNFIKISIVLFVVISSIFFFNVITLSNCRSLNVFKSINDFGIDHIYDCVSIQNVKNNIKLLLNKYPKLYSLSKYIYAKNVSNYALNILKTDNPEDNFIINSPLPEPIKGLANSELSKKNFSNVENIPFSESRSWLRSHGGNSNLKYNESSFINKKNLHNLKLIWSYQSIDHKNIKSKWKQNIELNPVYINKKIIFVTPDWKIVALNALNGAMIWELQTLFQPSRRGIVTEYDKELNKEVVFFPINNRIYKIDANTGKKIKNFGNNGYIQSTTVIAPIIYKNYLIVLTFNSRSLFVFDKRSGKLKWSLTLHPERNFTGGAPWGGAAFDNKKGIVYVSTGNPQPSLYGANRTGSNKNSASIVAVSIEKKEIIWSFQETIHDLWDFDIASPPIIHNLKLNSNIYETVIAVTKRGNTLILERNTGRPIFDINFKKAPLSEITGEVSSPFQIEIKKPEPFSKIEYTKKDFDKLSSKNKKEIKKIFKESKHGWFETPSFEKDLIMFGLHGGGQWPGAALDPLNQNLYIPVNNVPYILRPYLQSTEIYTKFPDELMPAYKIYKNECSSCHGIYRNGINIKKSETRIKYIPNLIGYFILPELKEKFISYKALLKKHDNLNIRNEDFVKLQNLFKFWDNKLLLNKEISVEANNNSWHEFLTSDRMPASNPPYGYITKLNLETGKIMWKSIFGYQQFEGKIKKIGTENFGGIAVNGAGLIFATGTTDNKAYVYDGESGDELWSFEMEAAGSTSPILFTIGKKQFVSFLSTGGTYNSFKNKGSTLYTFSIN
jgi:quinoprotein glucose dehydrogenase